MHFQQPLWDKSQFMSFFRHCMQLCTTFSWSLKSCKMGKENPRQKRMGSHAKEGHSDTSFFWHSPMGKRRTYIQNIIFMLMPCILPSMLDRKKWFVPSCHPFLTSCHFLGFLDQNISNKSRETDAVDGVISSSSFLCQPREKILVLEVKKVSAFSSSS